MRKPGIASEEGGAPSSSSSGEAGGDEAENDDELEYKRAHALVAATNSHHANWLRIAEYLAKVEATTPNMRKDTVKEGKTEREKKFAAMDKLFGRASEFSISCCLCQLIPPPRR